MKGVVRVASDRFEIDAPGKKIVAEKKWEKKAESEN